MGRKTRDNTGSAKGGRRRLRTGKLYGLGVVVVAVVLLEALQIVQYAYSHDMLEEEVECNSILYLVTADLRIQEVLSKAEVATENEQLHVVENLDNPEYMYSIIYNLVENDDDNLDGAFVCFKPGFYPSKGYWYEPYARQKDGKIECMQVGSEGHDYTKREYYLNVMQGDSVTWTNPYWDGYVQNGQVITYAVPIVQRGETVGVLGVDLSTNWINDVMNQYNPSKSSFAIALSEDGKLLAAPEYGKTGKSVVSKLVAMYSNGMVEKEHTGHGRVERFSFYDDERGEYGRVYYTVKDKSPKWVMMLVCYDDEIFYDLDTQHKTMLCLNIAGVAILSLIVWLFVRSSRRLRKSELEQEIINGELKVANEIQQSMLPRNRMQREDVSLFGLLLPAREVGGDLYDYFVKDEKLYFCIGDVSGKGAPAAMLMAGTRSLFRAFSSRESNPARIVKAINEEACKGNDANMFVTLFVGVLDLPTGRLRYCNAGHDTPIVVRGSATVTGEGGLANPNPRLSALKCAHHLPVGVFEDVKYGMQEMLLEAGSTIFLYTDGLTEAKNEGGKFFGSERTYEIVGCCAERNFSPEQIVERVKAETGRFARGTQQSDDLTLLVIHYTPRQYESVISETLALENRMEEVERLSSFQKEMYGKMGLEKALAAKIRLAVEEAVVNVIDYAYPADTVGNIRISISSDGRMLKVVVRDRGRAFDPTKIEKTDTTLSTEDRQIGGLGFLLVRELMDTINYERIEGENVLTMLKNLETPSKL